MNKARKKEIIVERYYDLIGMIERSEKAYKEKAPAFLMSVKHNLNIADLNRQCRLRGPRK